MKQFITFLVITFCIYMPANAQDYIWAKNIAGAGGAGGGFFEQSKSITTDALGNVYITGSVASQTVDFDPGLGTNTLQAVGNLPYNIFYAKYDANGNYLWAKIISTWGYGTSIAVDGSGNIYITGLYNGVTDFDPGIGTATLNSISTSWSPFFAKYDSNGNYVWAKGIFGNGTTGNNNNDTERNAICLDISGNVYITGRFYGTADFDPSPGTASLTALITGTTQYSDIFFAKYDNNGNYLWAKKIGGPNEDVGNSIKTDASSNVYVTGYFNNIVDFDPGAGTATLSAAGNGTNDSDIFFGKYDSNGNYIWANSISSPNLSDAGNSIAVDASNNVYVAGNFSGIADFDPSVSTATLIGATSVNHFVAKYNSLGNYLWAKTSDTNTNTAAIKTECNSLALDASNNVYITGNFIGQSIDFDPGTGIEFMSSESGTGPWSSVLLFGTDIYIAKYDNSGNYVWAKTINRTNNNNSNYNANYVNNSNSIALSAFGQVYITGYFSTTSPTTLDFDHGVGTATLSAVAVEDIFFAKYNSCPSPSITASSGSICPGQTYTMSVGGASTYSVNSTAASMYTFSPLSTTIYSVTGTNSLACSSANPITATITVASSPTVSASSATICSGIVHTISVGGANTYSINGIGVVNFTVNPVISSNYSVTGTGTNGCVSSNTAIAAVTVYSLPLIIANSGSICAGDTYSMVLNGANSYSINGTSSTNNFTLSPLLTTSYIITGTGTNGCVSNNAAVATITVHALPVVNASSGTVCIGKVYTINVSGASSYSINGNNTNSFTFSPVSTTQYSVTGTSSVGCVSNNTTLVTVTVFSLPLVSASSGSLCSGQIYSLNVNGANTYSVNGNAVNSLTFSPNSNTTYFITGSSIQGCVSSNTAVATISVSASPTLSVNNPSVCTGQAAMLTASGANLYSWNNNYINCLFQYW